MGKHFNIPIFIPHLGCPFNCIFCDQKKIASPQGVPEVKDIKDIIEEHLATIPEEAEVEVAFFGGNFTAIRRERQEAYLRQVFPYIEAGRITGIRISTRPDYIDEEILLFLKSWQVKVIELGVQSLHDEVLKASHRGYRAGDVFKACHLIKGHGFMLGIQLMVGLPADSHLRSLESAHLAASLKPDMVRIYPTLVISGTALEEMFVKGEYKPWSLEEAVKTATDMFLLFASQAIPVIRMGLQPSEELRSEGVVVAGPFHPAFGELVKGEVFLRQSELLLAATPDLQKEEEITFFVHPRDVSKMTGNQKKNIRYLKAKYGFRAVKVKAYSGLNEGALGIGQGEKLYKVWEREDFLKRLPVFVEKG
ncbi:Radical SAM superfamily protein [Thermosyntropha lipolytica DSM 11003]|uniref:Radical SAM superfamily protein n=1 Tax=Thermosyntropha lipolytica DSM 11003 TaxID=1123382 RepID=A0A1M5PIV6_9FIRM|nr:radical SAM protein [Thermosyntropha lipolytica]SHH01645.1 Radical SAM superfamily protein [Thermosyntropha lipolytica DSM 11003]